MNHKDKTFGKAITFQDDRKCCPKYSEVTNFYFERCRPTSSHQSFHRARGHGAAEMQAMPSSFDARSGRGEVLWSVPFGFEGFVDENFWISSLVF